MNQIAEIRRSNQIESLHHGHIAVVNKDGEILYSFGNPMKKTFMRSAEKPIQALAALLAGAKDRFHLSPEEIAIMCGSHFGEKIHLRTVARYLYKMKLSEKNLLCPPAYSSKEHVKIDQLTNHRILDEKNSPCSGKHTGFLAACLLNNYQLETYTAFEHPLQQEILQILSDFTDIAPEHIELGVDHCGAPVHYLSLYDMAKSYSRFVSGSNLKEKYLPHLSDIFTSVNECPDMIAGHGGFDTELLRATKGKLIAKYGAEAVFCVGVKEQGLGIAVKISDGSSRALPPVVIEILSQLQLLSQEERQTLSYFVRPSLPNGLGFPTGEIIPTFILQ